MSFDIDTGDKHPDIQTISSRVRGNGVIHIRDRARCEKEARRVVENIESHEDADALRSYWEREDLLLEAINLHDPWVFNEIHDAYLAQLSYLEHGARSAEADLASQDDGYW